MKTIGIIAHCVGALFGRHPTAEARRLTHSVSSTRAYEGCPRRYRFGYLERRPQDRPAPESWRFGSLVHLGLEAAYRLAMTTPATSMAERRLAAGAAIDEGCPGLLLDHDPAVRGRAVWHVTRALAQDVIGLGGAEVLGVEIGLGDRLSEHERIAGFADLVLRRPDGTVEIVDHKVTRHYATPTSLADDLQLNLYGYLAGLRWPGVPIVATHHYPLGPDAVSVPLSSAGMHAARARLTAVADRIHHDQRFDPTPSGRCAHCPWQPSCPEGASFVATP
jgi:RecB family exonuclease